MAPPLLIARTPESDIELLPGLSNRHGLITGATGTGKTVTLQVIAERFSAHRRAGLHGRRQGRPGRDQPARGPLAQARRAARFHRGRDASLRRHAPRCSGTSSGEQGHPVRATISDLGPLLLGRILNLNDTQAGVLALVFKVADDNGLLLLDLKDLRAMLQFVGENASEFTDQLRQRVGGLHRRDPARPAGPRAAGGRPFHRRADARHRRPPADGRRPGAWSTSSPRTSCCTSPKLYSTLLLWLLSELYEHLPEVGDPRQAEARVLLRRSASALHRRAAGAAREDRAGRAPHPLQGRRRLSSSPRTRWTCRTPCSASSATASSTRFAPSRRATRKQ